MRFVMITIFAVTGSLVALATANPVPNSKAGGIAIPLTRHSSSPNTLKSIDLDAIRSHAISVREKILRGLDNYQMNTGTMHPFAVKQSDSESGLGRRGSSMALTIQQDNVWTGKISIGTPPKTLKVLIDTGAADMWVLETECTGISGDRDLWDPISSKSSQYDGQPFQIEYADGMIIRGGLWTDNVTICGFTADSQTFGSATSITASEVHNGVEYPADGLLGLAFPSMSRFGVDPLFVSLARQGRLTNPTFSLKLSPLGAEMYVGGANSMLYKGDIAYTSITYPGFWQVSMDDVRVNGNIIFENVPAIFDTGANFIFGDWDQVAELCRRLGGTLMERAGYGHYHLPCDSFPTLGLTFGGRLFEIPPEVLNIGPVSEGSPICLIAIIAEHSSYALWIIGAPFLQGVYSVFDYGTSKVGFADLA